ncbi:sarcosine oxidase subunit beta [Polaromonas sp. OV174]|uniref:NAD(P)/FAD-dependent oxidoreductase n=1 Tax=Polaromonas sp. OV174 TaxID=1855300 RepID=UPI0008EBEB59|nr:FAD-dependent oxidoreductase [Polaromonas sp. OV174]SFB69230.1 sarcosine oxidase subunit beta [Polaromonas sp. OV174]
MRERLSADVAIIGGGIMGASAALFLRRMGLSVVLLERDLCGSRSSGVNYGGVRRQGRPLSQLPLSQRAQGLWAQLPELIGLDGEYQRSGHLKIARSEADLAALESYRERTQDFGMALEMLSARALRERCPWLGQAAVGASLCPEDGQANPRLVSPAFARAAQRQGADIREQTRVDEVTHDGAAFVLRSGEVLEVRAKHLLNCAGAWAGSIAAQFGEAVPMESGHPEMAVTEPLPLFLNFSLGVEGGGVYARQVARGNCVIGGGRGYALDEQRARVQRSGLAALMQQTVELLPALRNAHIIRTWSGTEGYLPDRQPVLGPSATTPGLIHAFGFAGGGFQLGPAVGAVLADLVRDGQTSTPIEAFSVSRFSESPRVATTGLFPSAVV